MTLKATSRKQEVFEPLVEYLKIAFEVEPTSQRMFNCETGVYFQFLSLKKKGSKFLALSNSEKIINLTQALSDSGFQAEVRRAILMEALTAPKVA